MRIVPATTAVPTPEQAQQAETVAHNANTEPRATGPGDAVKGLSRKRFRRARLGYPQSYKIMKRPSVFALMGYEQPPVCGRTFCYRAQLMREPI